MIAGEVLEPTAATLYSGTAQADCGTPRNKFLECSSGFQGARSPLII
jgi:hypothetical protein